MNDPALDRELEALVGELQAALEEARLQDPLLEVEYLVVPPGRVGAYGDLGLPEHVVRALYVSGPGESGVACQRDAALWTDGEAPTQVYLDDVMDRSELVRLAGGGAERLADALDTVRAFMSEILPRR